MSPRTRDHPPADRSLAFGAKVALARAVGAVSRRSGRGGGTTLPGRLLLRMDGRAIARLGARLPDGSTVISATNGKTTTAGMLAAILEASGRRLVHNRAGSNMHWGVATALLEQRGTEGLFEVDEAWLGSVAADLEPRAIVLANLFRDQLDRYGELERLAGEWEKIVTARAGATAFVLNADDPQIAELGLEPGGERREGVTFFGIDDPAVALPRLSHAHDAKFSRRTRSPYEYAHAYVGHLGAWRCPGEGTERPPRDVSAEQVELRGMEGTGLLLRTPLGSARVDLPLPGLYNVYNALAAAAAALRLGADLEHVRTGLHGMRAVFGRVEQLEISGRRTAILLIKNPTGANEVIRTVELEAGTDGLDLWIALNDRTADGRDVSWVWDADFEDLAHAVRTVTCAGTRAAEMAVRLKYAGWPVDRIDVVEGVERSLDRALARSAERLFCLPTYTALLELRTLLSRRGLAPAYWS